MKISYNWLKDYISTDLGPDKTAEILTAIGLETEAVEIVEKIPGGLRGVVVGEVLSCTMHPGADRLRITTVNLGDGDPVQIVCGAPNVAAGQKVLVATVGTVLNPSSGETFTIKKSRIRGAESAGMICAEDELGLGNSHDGILVLDPSVSPGTPASSALSLQDDHVFEIGLTPNRTDAFSHFGVARDLVAALKNMHGIERKNVFLKPPVIPKISFTGSNPAFSLEVVDTVACPRYSGILLENISVAPSPEWLFERLTAIGVRPVNNVVDITNYIQHEFGQPLHAFDADKIQGKKVVVRKAKEGEQITTLDGISRELSTDDLVICDAVRPMCIAGVFGGLDSGVNTNTTTVFLESAYFHSAMIRKTARRHGLNTDASFRFERGTDHNQVIPSLERAVALLHEFAGATIASPVIENYPEPVAPVDVKYRWSVVNRLIGAEIPREEVKNILNDLDFVLLEENDEELLLQVPFYRTDVHREADVVEEVLRIYGYDAIGFPQSLKSSISFSIKPDTEKIRQRISDFLVAKGFSEMMGMSLVKTKYAELFPSGDVVKEKEIALLNPLSSDLGVMRQSLLFSGLEAISLNQNHRQSDLRLFEFGKTYRCENEKFAEEDQLSVFLTGLRFPESWNQQKELV
ncbi:MAG: phenylalanine--tRNA ligase subunit beta, partial [Crocinitomicaceae bacterium]|nr:phenylalanine--tRNA ligase subunit beta [Crocinitomicaceae bacterium]